VFGTRPTAHSRASHCHARVAESNVERTVGAPLDALERRIEQELDALAHRNLQQPVADLRVIAAQDLVAAVDDGDLRAELVEDARELVRDVAAAGDQDALRQLLEMEGVVRSDRVLDAGNRRDLRPARPVAIRMTFSAEVCARRSVQLPGPGDDGRVLRDLDMVRFERLADNSPLRRVTSRETRCRATSGQSNDAPASCQPKGDAVLQVFRKMRAYTCSFFGSAAAHDARAADAMLLRRSPLSRP
jgi:hypothetical protein